MIVILYYNIVINKFAKLRVGNLGIACLTVGYIKHGEIRLMVSGGCIVIIIKGIENYND